MAPLFTNVFVFVVLLRERALAISGSAAASERCEANSISTSQDSGSQEERAAALLQVATRQTDLSRRYLPPKIGAERMTLDDSHDVRLSHAKLVLFKLSELAANVQTNLHRQHPQRKIGAERMTIFDSSHEGLVSSLDTGGPTWRSVVKLDEEQREKVAEETGISLQVMDAIEKLLSKMGGAIVNPTRMYNFAASTNLRINESTKILIEDLRKAASNKDTWLLLPPPEKGPLLYNMIRSDPWECDLVPKNDRRQFTCREEPDSESLDPKSLTCGADDSCSIEHANSYRTLMSIGSLPCCPTTPFCAAPLCGQDVVADKNATCTKRPPEAYVEYMKHPDSWPAYHGWGGSFELDTLKFLDLLACKGGKECPETTFDLVLDLGANTGYYSEKLTVRKFGQNYLMIDANTKTTDVLKDRWGNDEWRKAWFTQQVPIDGKVPDFEILTFPLSNTSGGILDMCETEDSMARSDEGCKVPVKSIDDIVSNELSPRFQSYFHDAQSAFIKIDTEGMDELVLRGMKKLLSETRGKYADEKPRHLVNFLQFEYSPALMKIAKNRQGFHEYDIHSITKFLESVGFESFMIGPRFLPLSHGSWHPEFKSWTEDPANNAGKRTRYEDFDDRVCPWCKTMDTPSFTADIVAIRSSHPRATELKIALGACKESRDFSLKDPQYHFVAPS